MKSDDIEKTSGSLSLESVSQLGLDNDSTNEINANVADPKPQGWCKRWTASIQNMEGRGIEPVPLDERQPLTPSTSLHMLLMWFSMTLATNNIIVGSMGTLVLGLRFKDAALCAVFGNLVGAATVGYMSIWGPVSGSRTLVS